MGGLQGQLAPYYQWQTGASEHGRSRAVALLVPKQARLFVLLTWRKAGDGKGVPMLELGVYHNGASDLPKRISSDGVVINDGTLADSHVSFQRALTAQVRQGVLADRLGFNYWFMSEHHFQPEGPEFSPNPLLVETAIAAQTRQLRLGQQANIITWWEPIRLAEQAAMLDVISGGRLEFGIGRGYQPRESEATGLAQRSRIKSGIEPIFTRLTKSFSRRGRSHLSHIMGSSSAFRRVGPSGITSKQLPTSATHILGVE